MRIEPRQRMKGNTVLVLFVLATAACQPNSETPEATTQRDAEISRGTHAAPAADSSLMLQRMFHIAERTDPALQADIPEIQKRRIFERKLARNPRIYTKNKEFAVLFREYNAIVGTGPAAGPDAGDVSPWFDTYYRPSVAAEARLQIPAIIRERHSWDTIPRYLAIWKNTEREGDWTDEEVSILASLDMIQLSAPTDESGKRQMPLAARLKKRNPNVIILGYRNLCLNYGSFDGELFQAHPEWHLVLRGKEDLPVNDLSRYATHGPTGAKARRPLYDVRIPQVRDWWIRDIAEQIASPDYDGVLIDAFAKAITPWGPRVKATGRGRQELMEFNRALNVLLADNARVNGPNGIIIGNALRSVYTDCLKSYIDAYLHGSYLEAIEQNGPELYNDHLSHLIDTCIQIQAEGGERVMAFNLSVESPPRPVNGSAAGGPGGAHYYDEYHGAEFRKLDLEGRMKVMRRNFEYRLALALVMAPRYAYICYAAEHDAAQPRALWAPDYPEFRKRLGPPRGPAQKSGPFAYARSFRYAEVKLDISSRTAAIAWK